MSHDVIHSIIAEAEKLCRLGHAEAALNALADIGDGSEQEGDYDVRRLITRGTALCHLGKVLSGLEALREAVVRSRNITTDLQFSAAAALFARESTFLSPQEALPKISHLRQLAASLGDAPSLASLHLAVSRLEACRGNCIDAQHHIEIARRFAEHSGSGSLLCSVDSVESGLELVLGNLVRARFLAEAAFERARLLGLTTLQLGCATNLGTIGVWTGNPTRARHYLEHVLSSSERSALVRGGALDALAQLAFFEGKSTDCVRLIEECDAIQRGNEVPCPSWNQLSSELTRCSCLELTGNWRRVVQVAEEVDAELARRNLRALRTLMLCSQARALARLGEFQQATEPLGTAVRTCPRGAIDPLIVLEATKGVCLSLSSGLARGAAHFDRALAACKAIGHRYHERWIERDRQELIRSKRETVRIQRHDLDLTDAALLVSDAATILGAGRSIDLLAHGAVEILRSVRNGPAVEVTHQSGRPHQPELTASTEAEADGTFTIRLRGSDRSVAIRIRQVQSLDEILLVRSVAELVRVAVSRTAESDTEDDEQNLWPKSLLPSGEDAVFRSPRMTELLKIAIRLAATDLPILLTGETGTGKEVFARIIHEHSQVKRGPFVAYNCSAMPRDLVESQLFGHRRGAFTGATNSFPGIIRGAERGTLFLDEVGDLDPAIQPKLLRFLEGAEIHPIGELKPQRVPVRIVAATNADLDEMVDQQRFRRDLFYRLGVAKLALPPLRERKDEIPALASLFLERHSRECRRTGLRVGDDLIAALLLYDWPGNIRQLSNEIRRVVAMAEDGQRLAVADLDPEITRNWNSRAPLPPPVEDSGPMFKVRLDQPLEQAIEALERQFIDRAMEASSGRVAEAAQLLGISRKGLFLKRRRRGLVKD